MASDPPPGAVDRIRLLLVEDHLVFADALARCLGAEPDLEVIAIATSLAEASGLLHRPGCDVLVLDIALPDGSGLDLLQRLEAENHRPPTVVLTAHADLGTSVHAVRSGANAVLSKLARPEELMAAIRTVAAGGGHLAPEVLGPVLEALRGHARSEVAARVPGVHRLSDRERDVLQCLVDGMDRQEIAAALYISVNTVRTHVRRVLQKLEVHSQLEAVHVARSSGLDPRERGAGTPERQPESPR